MQGALGLRRVAGAHRGADIHVGQAQRRQFGADALQRCVQVDVDVVAQRLQRRDVDHQGLVRQPLRQALAHQGIKLGQERGQGLARAGGRGHQRVAAAGDGRPRRHLCFRGRRECAREPAGDGGMEGVQRRMQGMPLGHAGIIRPALPGGMNGMDEVEADLRVHPRRLRGARLSR